MTGPVTDRVVATAGQAVRTVGAEKFANARLGGETAAIEVRAAAPDVATDLRAGVQAAEGRAKALLDSFLDTNKTNGPARSTVGEPKGGHGPEWDLVPEVDPTRLPIAVRSLRTEGVRFTSKGVDVVASHIARFGPDELNETMIRRLRAIVDGRLQPSSVDLNFYTHELREFVRYRAEGWAVGAPDQGEARLLWLRAHVATLIEYGLPVRSRDNLSLLYLIEGEE